MRYLIVLSLILALNNSCKNQDDKSIVKEYFENGNLKREYQVVADTIKNGYWKEFYESGTIKRILYFHLDTLFYGLTYLENGKIDKEKYYPKYKSSSDTIFLGDTLYVECSLYGINKFIGKRIFSSIFPNKEYEKNRGVTMSADSFKGYHRREYIPDTVGEYTSLVSLKLTDSLQKLHEYAWSTDFVVLPRR